MSPQSNQANQRPEPSYGSQVGGELPPRRHRRGHTKSRAGCKNCKRRKVKCDELKPVCGNCIRFGMVCDFSPISTQHIPVKVPSPEPVEKRKPGRPRKYWSQTAVGHNDNDNVDPELGSSSNTLSEPSPSSMALSPAELTSPLFTSVIDYLDLMHCWTVHTAASFGTGDVWRNQVPPLSFQHPCLCHSILAMAAQHSSRLKPLESERYVVLAEHHYELAVREATLQLGHLSLDNAQAMYGTMVMVSFYYFARTPSPGDLLVFSDGRTVHWMPLLQGVKYVLQTLGHSAIFHGIFSIEPEQDESECSQDTTSLGSPSPTWLEPLTELAQMIEQSDHPFSPCYAQAASDLMHCYQATYGTSNNPLSYNDGKFPDIMGWLYRMDDQFILHLQEKMPVPLILLAYFAVLLKSLESYWFMEGWAKHLLHEVNGILDPQYTKWLDWPASQIMGPDANSGMDIYSNHCFETTTGMIMPEELI
ncbi:C6 zinc finger protein [Dactylonectria macrodidyma]|uniref:C6 zinc finger protein n=1 Tax=Dactylonectria macrodidyma TaxID=307937 RepID=A0A9P9IQE0_9HYPO|nr:C6 zinc finger protein [Dactylonectria macrodidyma]